MKILLLAPHPFYQERGTPIAVNMLLKVLSERGDSVDALTYHVGSDVSHPNVAIRRIKPIGFIKNVSPGFSFSKVLCDIRLHGLAMRTAKGGGYDVVHAVEESVFMAMRIGKRHGIPYVYDMDSSMPRQIVEKHPLLAFALPAMRWFETKAIRNAAAVAAVCDSLAETAREAGAKRIALVNDISLLRPSRPADRGEVRSMLGIDGTCFMYLGNLESYQGIDLLLEAFSILKELTGGAVLVVAGGTEAHIRKYRKTAAALGIEPLVRFAGPWPLDDMARLFAAADVLVSPRITGNNTPMKIYSYLDSGKAIIATTIPAHTQVLDESVAEMAPPEPDAVAAAMLLLMQNPDRREQLGAAARALARKKYCLERFRSNIVELYEGLEKDLDKARRSG